MNSPCPCCGYCPTCGRRNLQPYSPFIQPYWNQWQSGIGTVTGGDVLGAAQGGIGAQQMQRGNS